MLTHVFTLALALVGQTNTGPQSAPDSSQMSLAERAAAARKAAAEKAGRAEATRPDGPPPLTPEQRGSIQGSQYVNNFLHFRMELGEWDVLSADRMAISEAMARKYLNAGSTSSPYRVLWLGDRAGRNLQLSIIALPPGAPRDPDQLAPLMKKVALAQLAQASDVKEYKESLVWGDTAHPFAAFRVSCTIRDTPIVQSAQLTVVNGFLVSFTITGNSDQELNDALRYLKPRLAWTSVTP